MTCLKQIVFVINPVNSAKFRMFPSSETQGQIVGPPLWLLIGVRKRLCFLPNQKAERRRPFGTGLVRHWPQGLFRRSLLFFVPYFSARLDFPSPPLSAPGSLRMECFQKKCYFQGTPTRVDFFWFLASVQFNTLNPSQPIVETSSICWWLCSPLPAEKKLGKQTYVFVERYCQADRALHAGKCSELQGNLMWMAAGWAAEQKGKKKKQAKRLNFP